MKGKIILGLSAAFLLFMAFYAVPAFSQEEEVREICFVYFTRNCPNCLIADSYVDKVKTGNNMIVVIQYNTDNPEVNMDVLNRYREEYDINFNSPLVLFKKNDFLVGVDDIRVYLQTRIDNLLTQEGNDCPLVDGTSVAPANLNAASLPGQPQIRQIITPESGEEIPENKSTDETPGTEDEGGIIVIDLPEPVKGFVEYVSMPENRILGFFIQASLIAIVLATVFTVLRKRKR